MVAVLGFDIGGANTKAAVVKVENAKVTEVDVAAEYFPVWKEPDGLADVLLNLKSKLNADPDCLGVTMTAELSDAYQTKREGVNRILSCVEKAFPNLPAYVLTTDVQMVSSKEAKQNPLGAAAANWAATGWLVSQRLKDAVVVDVGSTSTSIIPIADGRLVAKGKTDLEKLVCGELVYTGSLRTNIAAIVHSVPTSRGVAAVASELFALSGDVHLILGHITAGDYTSETADGRGKTAAEAMARLARVVCADTEMLREKEIMEMAQYIYQQQITQITAGLSRVYSYAKAFSSSKVPVVVTGLGKDFLARRAAEKIGADVIIELDSILPKQAVIATPAVGVALMAANKATGEPIAWI